MKFLLLLLLISYFTFSYPQTNYNVEKFEYISPVPGSSLLTPQTNIIIRYGEALSNLNKSDTSIIRVEGNLSGYHAGTLYLTKDSKTIVFTPLEPFLNSEKVVVSLSTGLVTITSKNVDSLNYYFFISKNSPLLKNSLTQLSTKTLIENNSRVTNQFQLPGDSTLLFPTDFPKVFIRHTDEKNGLFFIGINQSSYNYLTIINNYGIPVYYRRSSARLYDFKLQPSGILTYFDADKSVFYGMDNLYQVVDSFYCQNGYSTNFHELQVLPNGHSFLLSYDPQIINMDTVKHGGDTAAVVYGSVIQEINEDKVVIWQWRTWDHYKITDADSSFVDFYQHTVEYSHINSIDVVDNDRIIFSVKNFNEITEVDRNTGKIIWRMGGYNNQFSFTKNNSQFEQQHDARIIEGNKLTVFDNRKFETSENSRALIFKIDDQNKTADLIHTISHEPEIRSKNMGNVQLTTNNNFVIGWGNSGRKSFYMSEVDTAGNTTSNDSLVSQSFIYSYRAFKFPWKAKFITSDKDSLLFSNSSSGIVSFDSIAVKNNSSTPLDIGGVFYNKSDFTPTDIFPIQLLPGEEIYLHFKFQSSKNSEVKDLAYIAAYKKNEMAVLPIILIGNSVTGIQTDNVNNPNQFKLSQNFPNPFNPLTNISYSLALESRVKILIYNVLGEEITTLIDNVQNAGRYKINWNANEFPSGIYFYKFFATSVTGQREYFAVKKMILLK